jgi:hypothetical protein
LGQSIADGPPGVRLWCTVALSVQITAFTSEQVDSVIMDVEGIGFEVQYAPYMDKPNIYTEIMSVEGYEKIHSSETGEDITPATDDRPFYYDFDVNNSQIKYLVAVQMLVALSLFVPIRSRILKMSRYGVSHIIWFAYFGLIGVAYYATNSILGVF